MRTRQFRAEGVSFGKQEEARTRDPGIGPVMCLTMNYKTLNSPLIFQEKTRPGDDFGVTMVIEDWFCWEDGGSVFSHRTKRKLIQWLKQLYRHGQIEP